MFRHLRIQNFKCWQDTGPIRMAPLTLFFGANSSGKSSLGHFLMMLKQTAELADRKTVLTSGAEHSSVQLGSHQDMLFDRDLTRKMAFEYDWDLRGSLTLESFVSTTPHRVARLGFSAVAGLQDHGHRDWVLDHFVYRLLRMDSQQALAIGIKRTNGAEPTYSLECEGYDVPAFYSTDAPTKFFGFPDKVISSHQHAVFFQKLQTQQEDLLRSISYLGPIRTKAERLYSWTGAKPLSVGATGEHTIAALLASAQRRLNVGEGDQPFSAIIAAKLLQMDLIDAFQINPTSPQRQNYNVQVRTKGSRHWVDLADTGFGLSQILPVLVQGFYAPPHSTIVVEQPELHLHPRAQSELADVLISMVQAQESDAPRNIQLIIETHSEHLLRRLQRRIAEDRIPQSDVAAYFAQMSQSGAQLEPLAIDDCGNITNWPRGFFGEEMADVIHHGKAALNKRLRQLKGNHDPKQ